MKARSIPDVICILLISVLFPGILPSATYHVDANHPSASDSNPGTSDLPWLTLQHAADTVVPGDSVLVMSGTYTGVTFSGSGSSGSPITFQGESMAAVIIDGGMEFDTGISYMNVANFSLVENFTWGVFLRGTNQYINVRHVVVSGGDNGFHLTWGYQGEDPLDGPVSDILIEDCFVNDGLYTGVDCTPGPCDRVTVSNVEVYGMGIEASWGADGIAFERGEYITVEDCYVHDNAGDGIDIGSRNHAGYVDGIIVRRNRVARNHMTGIKVWAGGRIQNNVVWGQGNTPMALGAFPGTYEVINNTIAYNMWDPDFGIRNYSFVVAYPNDETGISAACDLTLLNNIFAFNCNDDHGGPTGLYLGEGVTLVSEGYNLYWSREYGEIQADFVVGDPWFSREMIADGTWTAATGQGEGNVTSDPLFVSAWPNADVHLTSGSPAVDTGTSIGEITSDVEGNPRPSGGGFDIGAYEYQESVQAPVAQFSANPTTGQGNTCQVHFTDQSSGTITGWAWDFGDGETSHEQNPDHTYACHSPYTVSLTVSGPGGSDNEMKTDYIECDCPCQISLTAPGGGETWCVGESESITWTSNYTSGYVNIEYSTDGAGSWLSVTSSTSDDGLYIWTIPNVSSTDCVVKISDSSDPGCRDVSHSAFRICLCGSIEITTENLSDGTLGCSYSQTVDAAGGCPPYAWSIVSGQLPGGIHLESSSGTISGEPNETGAFVVTVLVSDVLEGSAEKVFSFQIDAYENEKGDVNGDCTVDIRDVVVLINVILDIYQPGSDEIWRCDCNGPQGDCDGDGIINILDAVKVVGFILGTDSCP